MTLVPFITPSYYSGRCRESQAESNFTECVDFCTFEGMEMCFCSNLVS